jgi:undecaprenyl pyrophosphate synthase
LVAYYLIIGMAGSLISPSPNVVSFIFAAAFIMDGNRRYAKFRSMQEGAGHRMGFSALIASLLYCYEMGVKYITVYAFGIDNFKRDPSEVESFILDAVNGGKKSMNY